MVAGNKVMYKEKFAWPRGAVKNLTVETTAKHIIPKKDLKGYLTPILYRKMVAVYPDVTPAITVRVCVSTTTKSGTELAIPNTNEVQCPCVEKQTKKVM